MGTLILIIICHKYTTDTDWSFPAEVWDFLTHLIVGVLTDHFPSFVITLGGWVVGGGWWVVRTDHWNWVSYLTIEWPLGQNYILITAPARHNYNVITNTASLNYRRKQFYKLCVPSIRNTSLAHKYGRETRHCARHFPMKIPYFVSLIWTQCSRI